MSEKAAVDVVLVGAGIMSATLGTLLRKLEPSMTIEILERLDTAAAESSDAWNNAGTGHSGFCELNYTPQKPDGSVDVGKAIDIAAQFQKSLALWGALVDSGDLPEASTFLRPVPHIAFVEGFDDVTFLRARTAGLRTSPLFAGMEHSEDPREIAAWAPLVMERRKTSLSKPVAATRVAGGTDVNFGALTRSMIDTLDKLDGVTVSFGCEVTDVKRDVDDGGDLWVLDVKDLKSGIERTVRARFVFIGAGGYSLSLLERSGIEEARGYGAFPVSGQWLRCTNPDVVKRHRAKVYGKAAVGAPPMSVPHLDSRWIGGTQELLFGPYAGFTTKFLKQGSLFDLVRSLGIHNVVPVMSAGAHNLDLTGYLVGQALLSVDDRLALLRTYYPQAQAPDWELQVAGLRVQIIKGDGKGRGELRFGTEVVTSKDGSMSALLGASPGASTAVAIMLQLLARCFPARWASSEWQQRLARWVPA